MTTTIPTRSRTRKWVGKKFGSWMVMSVPFIPRGKNRKHVLCRCTCSNTSVVACDNLRRGKSRQCMECHSPHHGYKNSPTHASWRCIVQRTTNENNNDFANYFGLIDPRWIGKNGFRTFIGEVGERPPNTTAGRFLDLGAYSKRTVSWMTREQQLWHRREATVLMTAMELGQVTRVEVWDLLGMYRRIWKDQIQETTK